MISQPACRAETPSPQTLHPFLRDVMILDLSPNKAPEHWISVCYWWLKNSALLQGELFIPVAVMIIKSMRLKHFKITGLMGNRY